MHTQQNWESILAANDVQQLIEIALAEDIGSGDTTTQSIFPESTLVKATICARTPTVACGIPLAKSLIKKFDPLAEFIFSADEGASISAKQNLLVVKCDIRGLLPVERTALNFLMRLCGIASAAKRASNLIPAHCKAKIFDTRKTTPGFRRLEKAAVATGGACNHRFGLFDAVLIKDNHIAKAGSITQAINSTRNLNPKSMVIEVEIDTLSQLDEALNANPDIILLDNFSIDDLHRAVKQAQNRVLLEASGGINESTIAGIAETGVDRISMGALTHTVLPADLGLDILPS